MRRGRYDDLRGGELHLLENFHKAKISLSLLRSNHTSRFRKANSIKSIA